jgi:hypothetical protein
LPGISGYPDLQRLAPEQTLGITHAQFQFTPMAGSDVAVIGPYRRLPVFGLQRLSPGTRLGEGPYGWETAETVMPGCIVCSTSRTFS